MEKVYEVEFMNYTNCMHEAVCDDRDFSNLKYLKIGKEPFLIKESDFDKYMKYGNGFRVVRFVGNIEQEEPKKEKLGEWVNLPIHPYAYRCGNIDCARAVPNGVDVNILSYCPFCGEKKKKIESEKEYETN